MDESIKHALERDRTIDITTTGRKTGQPRRTEIWFHNVEGRLYITGTPGRRNWYANVRAHPESLNFSHFVARQIWQRRDVSPRRYRAHR